MCTTPVKPCVGVFTLYLIRVELDQLVVVCLGQGKEGGGHTAMNPGMCDVAHAKEESHLSNNLAAPSLCQ